MSEKKHFKNTRDQFIDGQAFQAGDVVEIEADRVTYLIAAGFLEETEAPKKGGKAQKPQNKPEEPAVAEPQAAEPQAAE